MVDTRFADNGKLRPGGPKDFRGMVVSLDDILLGALSETVEAEWEVRRMRAHLASQTPIEAMDARSIRESAAAHEREVRANPAMYRPTDSLARAVEVAGDMDRIHATSGWFVDSKGRRLDYEVIVTHMDGKKVNRMWGEPWWKFW